MAENKKIAVAEVVELIEKIKDGATSSTTPLSEVLRLCLRLAKQLRNEQLAAWALSELNGYKSEKALLASGSLIATAILQYLGQIPK